VFDQRLLEQAACFALTLLATDLDIDYAISISSFVKSDFLI